MQVLSRIVYGYAKCVLSTRAVCRYISFPCRMTFSTSTSHLSDKLDVRLAKEQDFQGVLKASEGVYDGRDYLPFVFHQWLKTPGKYMFVGELHGKIIGFQAATVIDGGQTILGHSIRIHQEYRGRGYSYHMMAEVINQVHRFFPGTSKVRYMSYESNIQIIRFAQRLGYKALMKKRVSAFQIPKEKAVTLGRFKELYELNMNNAIKFVLDERNFDHIIPNKLLVVLKDPYELMPANSDFIFIKDDKMFTDLTTDELRHGSTPRSLSHGRLLKRVARQSWICNIYAMEKNIFTAHVVQQLKAAAEYLKKNELKADFYVLCFPDLEFDVSEVLREVLGLEEDVSDYIMIYEKPLY